MKQKLDKLYIIYAGFHVMNLKFDLERIIYGLSEFRWK